MRVNHADTLKSDMKNSVASSPTLDITGKVACLVYPIWDRDRSRRCGPQREEALRLHSPRHCPSKSCQHWQHQRKAGMLFMRMLKAFPQAQSQENLWRDHGGAARKPGRNSGVCRPIPVGQQSWGCAGRMPVVLGQAWCPCAPAILTGVTRGHPLSQLRPWAGIVGRDAVSPEPPPAKEEAPSSSSSDAATVRAV